MPQSSTPSKPTYPISRWYATASELPLDLFIKCICDGDLSALIISGEPTQDELAIAWGDIYEQYLDGMKDKTGLRKLKLLSKANNLQLVYDMGQLCLNRLSMSPKDIYVSQAAIEFLRTQIIVGEFNPEDQEGYISSLTVARNRVNQILIRIDDTRREYELLEQQDGAGAKVKITPKHFDTVIVQISLYVKFHISKKEVTLGEFINYYNAMRDEAEEIERQVNKQKR